MLIYETHNDKVSGDPVVSALWPQCEEAAAAAVVADEHLIVSLFI